MYACFNCRCFLCSYRTAVVDAGQLVGVGLEKPPMPAQQQSQQDPLQQPSSNSSSAYPSNGTVPASEWHSHGSSIAQPASGFSSDSAGGKRLEPRIFTFGIGPFCNHYFLKRLAGMCALAIVPLDPVPGTCSYNAMQPTVSRQVGGLPRRGYALPCFAVAYSSPSCCTTCLQQTATASPGPVLLPRPLCYVACSHWSRHE